MPGQCPTCDQAQAKIPQGCDDDKAFWYCPRCGTTVHGTNEYVPQIVLVLRPVFLREWAKENS